MFDYREIRRELHQIPELGFQEFETQKYLLNFLKSLPKDKVDIATWKTGILIKIKGTAPKRTVGFRADIDGLPIDEPAGVAYRSKYDGRMHACGHDVHMTIALGLCEKLVHNPIEDDVVVIFQPAEEGPGGAEPMMKSEEFKKWKPDLMCALHIAPEYPVGTIAIKEGLLFANTSELFIRFEGKGGHAAYPHQTRDMVVASSHFVTALQSIVSRNTNPLDSVVITIGKITSGTVQNVIAETAFLEGTIRTLSPESMIVTKDRIEKLIQATEIGFECNATLDYGSSYYQVYNDEATTSEFIEYCENQEKVNLVICDEAMTGEDFGYFLKEIPGFMLWLGVDSEYGLHNANLSPKEEAIPFAIDVMYGYFNQLK